jgi:hypothetical protein
MLRRMALVIVTWRNIQEDGILHSHRRGNLKSYMDWSGSGWAQVESSCELDNEPSGSTKCWETIEWLNNLWPLE